ncbi:hypothetical protein, partial [Sansalvadorimonas verongulae]|uniref:hypothetical protein n=1 Tax=Sansalvadorimonas verongulae TaxID=2172824 RepID=UPI001E5B181C
IEVVANKAAGAGGGQLESTQNTRFSQTDGQMNVTALDGNGSAGYIGQAKSTMHRNIVLSSGRNTGDSPLKAIGHIDDRVYIPGAKGFLDTAAYPPDQIEASRQMLSLNTTQPEGWRTAQETFCQQTSSCDSTCHYPNEQAHALVSGGHDSLFLVSHQRYPYNEQSDEQGVILISRLNWDGTALGKDSSFGRNGFLLYSPAASNGTLPPAEALVGQLADPTHLTTFYSTDSGGLQLVRFPLDNSQGGYEVTSLDGHFGQPVMFTPERETDRYGIWVRNDSATKDTVHYHQMSFSGTQTNVSAQYNLSVTDYPDTSVIGLGADHNWLYIARQNQTDIFLERMSRVTQEKDAWHARLEDARNVTPAPESGLAYRLQVDGNLLTFVPRYTVTDSTAAPRVVNVELPQYGGCAQWTSHDAYSVNINPGQAVPNFNWAGAAAMLVPAVLAGTTAIVCAHKHRGALKECLCASEAQDSEKIPLVRLPGT